MRKFLFLLLTGATLWAQETVELSLGAGYSNDVYFKFSDETNQSFDRNSWDIAFYRVSNFDQAIRINDGKGFNVYEASNDISQWETIGTSATSGEGLYNSDLAWNGGAFNQGSATYGWGEYNPVNHQVTGSVIFLIENTISSDIYKFMIENYYGGYNIKYALWNGTSWEADQTQFVSNTDGEGHFFNFLNLETGALVEASPATDAWDLKFTKFTTQYPVDGGTTPYVVTGALQNPDVTIAQVEEDTDATFADESTLTFSEDINTIGYDWKALNATWSYDIAENQVFYVKSNDIVYRLFFESFAGSSTGNFSFTYEAENLSTADAAANVKFAVYPNPVKNNQITLVYDNAKNLSEKAKVAIYNVAGQKVYETSLNNASGLFQRNLQLNNLTKGIYFLKFQVGNDIKTKKLLIQ